MNKLKEIPHILWINLEKDNDRRQYMENLFNEYNLKNTRIDALDGNDNNFFITNKKRINNKEYGCFCSHLKALEYFINSDLGDYCLIAEDDLSFEYLPYWKKTFWEYINETPDKYDIVQLSQIYSFNKIKKYTYDLTTKIHVVKHERNYYGCGLYLITKDGAKKILNTIPKKDGKYELSNVKTVISDSYIYGIVNSYTIPLFTHNTDFISNIHQDHIKRIHIPSKEIITNIWKNEL